MAEGTGASSDEVHTELVTHINNLQKEIKNIRKNLVQTLGMSVITVLIVLGISIWYSGHVRSIGDSHWCAIITSSIQRANDTPAPTDPKQAQARRDALQQLEQLRIDLGCD